MFSAINNISISTAVLLIASGVILTVVSQLLLKSAAREEYTNFVSQYVNLKVLTAYSLFFIVTILNVIALQKIPLSYAPVWNSAAIVGVSAASIVIFKESLNKRKAIGTLLILIGIFFFAVKLF